MDWMKGDTPGSLPCPGSPPELPAGLGKVHPCRTWNQGIAEVGITFKVESSPASTLGSLCGFLGCAVVEGTHHRPQIPPWQPWGLIIPWGAVPLHPGELHPCGC